VAFVEIRLSDTRETALKAFNTAVRAIPEIEQAHLIAGNFDYLLKVRVSDMSSYRQVLAEKLSTLPHISNTSTYVAMQAVKEDSSEAF
jgi:Lrp/AsnC family leucine-responsive transcriptional regulator